VKRTRFRVLLTLACLIAAGTALQDFRLHQSIAATQSRLTTVETETAALSVALSDLRAAQASYLAANQSPDFWMRRVTELSSEFDAGLARLREAVGSPAAASHVEGATSAIADLMGQDKRARGALQADQRFVASDVIFTDSTAPAQLVASELAAARTAAVDAASAALNRQSILRLVLTPLSLLAVLLLSFAAGRSSRVPESTPATIADMLRELPPPVKTPAPASTNTPAPIKLTVPAPPATPPVNLADAAELCVDLARVMDARDMQTLLERTAKVLEASGVILWVVNQERTSLLPVLTHGYSERVLLKLNALDVNAENVTSLSYRTVRPQTVPGTGPGTTSAIAVPLVTAGGCNGVLAAEVYETRPSADFVALSRLIAAQFATMINPCETAAAAHAAEA
jgi:hypothetical protein